MTVKDMCKNGVFGIMSDGDKFVVVDGFIVYERGNFDRVSVMSEDGEYSCYKVDKLFKNLHSFDSIDDCSENAVIFNRHKPVVMTLDEVRKKLNEPNLVIKG